MQYVPGAAVSGTVTSLLPVDTAPGAYGVESICDTLPIAPSTYFLRKAEQAQPMSRCARAQRDDDLRDETRRVWEANQQVYGPRKVWRQLRREKIEVARCTVRRLMQAMGLAGAVRGRAWTTTTESSATPDSRPDARSEGCQVRRTMARD